MELTKEILEYIKQISENEDMEQYILTELINNIEKLEEKNIKRFVTFRKKDYKRNEFAVTKIYGMKFFRERFMKMNRTDKNYVLDNIPKISDIDDFEDLQENSNSNLSSLELKEILEIIKNEIDEQEFKILCLFYINRFSLKDIAKALRVNTTNLKTKISRIKNKLRKNKDLRFIYNNLNM